MYEMHQLNVIYRDDIFSLVDKEIEGYVIKGWYKLFDACTNGQRFFHIYRFKTEIDARLIAKAIYKYLSNDEVELTAFVELNKEMFDDEAMKVLMRL
jgi:hypothetical protein